MNRELYNIFKKMPKPANLHIHFSAIVSYKKILCTIDEQKDLQENLYYNKKTKGLEYTKNPNDNHSKFNKSTIENIFHSMPKNVESLDTIGELGILFYGVIRYKYFFEKYYLPAIVSYMTNHNIKYMEIRTKLGSVYDISAQGQIAVPIIDELKMLYVYINKFKIIVQFSKCQDNKLVFNQISSIEELVKNTVYKNLIAAYDLVGDENICKDLNYFYPTLKQLKEKYHIKYYLHAGEILQSGKSKNNVKVAIDLGCKRIGHGINILYSNNPLMKQIVANHIMLEVCPLSNLLFYNYYPSIPNIVKYIDNIVISSDDDNKQKTNLSLEYLFLYNCGITIQQIKRLLLNTLKDLDQSRSKQGNTYNLDQFNKDFNSWYELYKNNLPNIEPNKYQLKYSDICD
jgi:hypothetical protein